MSAPDDRETVDPQTFGRPGSAADEEARAARPRPLGDNPDGGRDVGDDQDAGFQVGERFEPRNSPEPSDRLAPVDPETSDVGRVPPGIHARPGAGDLNE